MKNYLFVLALLSLVMIPVGAQKTAGLALTPPMGWNSWNRFGCDVSESLIMEMTDAMVESGMKEAGYTYIVIDDCWQVGRDENGKIIVDPERFPAGMKALADYVHSKGLKFGIYSCAGTHTCQGRPGSHGYEDSDAETYAGWGVDYLKYDFCNARGINQQKAYTDMSKALAKSGRPVVFSLCEWGTSRPWSWAKDVGHLWRTTFDILDCWNCLHDSTGMDWVRILDMQEGLEKYAGPDHWNDPDMLQVGNGNMTPDEYRAHFSFWCLLAAPLMAGNDLRDMDVFTQNILLNQDAISVNQDKAGIQGHKVYDDSDFEIWSKEQDNGDLAVIFFNRNSKRQNYPALWEKLGIKENMSVYDIWEHKEVGTCATIDSIQIDRHSVFFCRLSPIQNFREPKTRSKK